LSGHRDIFLKSPADCCTLKVFAIVSQIADAKISGKWGTGAIAEATICPPDCRVIFFLSL